MSAEHPPRIGGWLLFPAIGLILGPPLLLVGIVGKCISLVSASFARQAEQFSGLRPMMVFELVGAVFLLVFACVVAYVFFTKRRSTPNAVIAYMLTGTAFAVVQFVGGAAIFGLDDPLLVLSLLRSSGLIGVVLADAVWIPYFLVSKRVQATFIIGEERITEDAKPLTWHRATIWSGISTLALILVYASVGSAVAPIRGALEMTEVQVFQHWLFIVLVALFSVSLIIATLTCVKWTLINAGSLGVHVGLLMLVGGAVWYFGGKVEGDVVLVSPRIELSTSDGQPLPGGRFLAEAGQSWQQFVPALGGFVTCQVVATRACGSEPVGEAAVRAAVGDEPARLLKLAADQPAPTTLDSDLAVRLRTFPPQHKFYDDNVPALYFGRRGARTLNFVEIRGLPIHRERFLPGEDPPRDAADRVVVSKRSSPHVKLFGVSIWTGWFEQWRMPIALETPGLPFRVEITGYLPYIAGTEEAVSSDGCLVRRPVVQPLVLRRPGTGRGLSAIRLRLTGLGTFAGWSASRWCTFSVFPRFEPVVGMEAWMPEPITVRLPDGSEWELIYSRAERDLRTALVAGKLSVKFLPGRQSVESWRSDFYVTSDAGDGLQPAAVYANQTYTIGPWTLFQANAALDHWSWTDLGVGNRRGIWPMTIGSVLITLGCLYAFYVKPILRRRTTPASAAGARR